VCEICDVQQESEEQETEIKLVCSEEARNRKQESITSEHRRESGKI
jgi:hypothetical protein